MRILRTFKSAARRLWFRFDFWRCVRKLRLGLPDEALLVAIRRAWGNENWSGDVSYLAEVCKAAAATRGPVLECGSGLTTVLLGIYAAQRGVKVVSLEHLEDWERGVNRRLRRFHLPNRVSHAALQSYGDFDWYALPPDMTSGISLVICDGPPGDTRGGRYGLLPVCASHLADGCVILMDDAERMGEQAAISNWQNQYAVTVQVNQTTAGSYARLVSPIRPDA